MERRQFLAALGLLPTDATRPTPDIDATTNANLGTGMASLPTRSSVFSAVHVDEMLDDDTTIDVRSHWYDDQDPEVEITLSGANSRVVLGMSPERARDFSANLRLAALRAERGDAELGVSSQSA